MCTVIVLSDQAKEVDDKVMQEVYRLFGTEKLRTSANKPCPNIVECSNGTMNSELPKIVSSHQKDWDCRIVLQWLHIAPVGKTLAELLVVRREVYGAVDICSPDETDSPTIE